MLKACAVLAEKLAEVLEIDDVTTPSAELVNVGSLDVKFPADDESVLVCSSVHVVSTPRAELVTDPEGAYVVVLP